MSVKNQNEKLAPANLVGHQVQLAVVLRVVRTQDSRARVAERFRVEIVVVAAAVDFEIFAYYFIFGTVALQTIDVKIYVLFKFPQCLQCFSATQKKTPDRKRDRLAFVCFESSRLSN